VKHITGESLATRYAGGVNGADDCTVHVCFV